MLNPEVSSGSGIPNPPNKPFVDGEFVAEPNASLFPLVNPASEQIFAEVHCAGIETTNRAVSSAHRAWESDWRDLAPGRRAEILFNMARLIQREKDRIARLEMAQIGKPISDAQDEAGLGAKVFEYYAGAVGKFFGQTIPVSRGGFDFTLRQPLGVVAAIVPWNFPFPIACWKVAPALAAGNCVVLKPASISPLTALILGELCAEAGLPPGTLQILPGAGSAIGDALVQHELVRKISFTGSTSVGKHIMTLAANGLKRLSLELGGKSPNIIFSDSDWESAADSAPMSVFANTGQDCCARSRVFVERSIYRPFLDRFVQATRRLIVGAPHLNATQIGPLATQHQRNVVEEFIQDARQRGSSIECGGNRLPGPGFFFEPTILTGVSPNDRCWREEIFGPVACVVPFDDEADMLREVNRSPYGLSGSLWTNNLKRALRVSRAIQSGVLSVNSHSSVHVEAPFGGFKSSGLGRDLGMTALEGYTELKNVYVAP